MNEMNLIVMRGKGQHYTSMLSYTSILSSQMVRRELSGANITEHRDWPSEDDGPPDLIPF
jgi:hypothetical protein